MKIQNKYGVIVLLLYVSITSLPLYAQKIKYERVPITYYKKPLLVLDSAYKTYAISANIPDYMGGNYAAANLQYNMQNLKKVPNPGDIEVMLKYNYYTLFTNQQPTINTINRKEKVNNVEVNKTYYNKTCAFEQPYEYKIMNNKYGNSLGGRVDTWVFRITTPEYSTEQEAHNSWDSYVRGQVAAETQQLHNRIAAELSNKVSNLFYKGDATTTVDIYKIKDNKEYADLDSAYNIAIEAYKLLSNHTDTSRVVYSKAIQPATNIWLRAIAQKEDSKKARITSKIVNVLLFNLAYAAYWNRDWNIALQYAQAADENGKRDFWVKDFEKNIEQVKKRGGQ